MKTIRMWHFYTRQGTAYVPTVVQTEAGFFLDIEPVVVVAASDTESLVDALTNAITAENSVVPTPTRAAFPKPVVLKFAGVKSWTAFEKGAKCYSVYLTSDGYLIPSMELSPNGGWVENMRAAEKMSPAMSPAEVASRLAAKACSAN